MNMLTSNAETLQALTSTVHLLGVPIAIILFILAKRKEIRDRENGTYDSLDAKYQEFLNVCLNNPDLPLFDSGLTMPGPLTPEQEHRTQIAYCMLISILERSYLMYKDQTSSLRKKQWTGWESYMEDYLNFPPFAQQWRKLSIQFDTDFVRHMEALSERINKYPKEIPKPPASAA